VGVASAVGVGVASGLAVGVASGVAVGLASASGVGTGLSGELANCSSLIEKNIGISRLEDLVYDCCF
jgi:hypothetical protein